MKESKKKLFDDDSDENIDIKTENEYAKKYDSWRGKEELHKLEQKYGSKPLNSDASESSDSEDESDESLEVSEETEKQFLKMLSMLKCKDERIYDPNYQFFEDKAEAQEGPVRKAPSLSFADSDEDDGGGGDVFTVERRATRDDDTQLNSAKPTEAPVKLGAVGEGDRELGPLLALWADPALGADDAFLRDYILQRRYLEPDGGEGSAGEGKDRLHDDEPLEQDEQHVEEQRQFERAYNFRYEEPDQEYLKRFPRTMNYIRPKDDRRARKRAEVRARKEEEKKKKMEEIARMKALKLKEIQEKIAKIKEVTGNQDLAFQESDVEGEFDPEAHDRRMRALFDDAYYGEPEAHKPEFPDLDDELEIENWERFEREGAGGRATDDDGPHCEDDDFNMDAECIGERASLEEQMRAALVGAGGGRRRGRRRSKLAQLLAERRPRYVPGAGADDKDDTYARHMEQYYALDCEDVIAGDLPTRFKYREVPPNDYGLTVEEILLADDKELTQWVPLKKMLKLRGAAAEREQASQFQRRAADAALKRRMLPSLFRDLPPEPEIVDGEAGGETKKKKKKVKDNVNKVDDDVTTNVNDKENTELQARQDSVHIKKKKKHKEDIHEEEEGNVKKKKKHKEDVHDEGEGNIKEKKKHKEDVHNEDEGNTMKKKKHKESDIHNEDDGNRRANNDATAKETDVKKLEATKFIIEALENESTRPSRSDDTKLHSSKKKKKNKAMATVVKQKNSNIVHQKKKNKSNSQTKHHKGEGNRRKQKNNKKGGGEAAGGLSDARLRAFGLNPKKYRGFLRYRTY